jgi:Gpi18-like mannosyltransferase
MGSPEAGRRTKKRAGAVLEPVEPAEPAGEGAESRSRWAQALQLVTVTHLAYLVVAYAAMSFLASSTGSSEVGFVEMWTRWDARHFIQVAQFGYTDSRSDPHATAFFPLFPLLIRSLSATGISPALAGMVINAVATVVATAYLFKLAEEDVGAGAGRRAALYFLLFPTAVFLVAPYSEAIFVAGAVAAFYYARRRRWHLVALPAAVAMGARAAGIFLLLGLLFEFVRQRDFAPRRIVATLVALAAGALPLMAYGIYLARIRGDPFYFFTDQRLGWQRELTNPIQSLLTTLHATQVPAGAGNLTNFVIAWRVEVVAAAAGLGFTIWAVIQREWGYAAFMGSFMVALMTSSIYFSIPRMMLSLFPIVLFLAAWTLRHPVRHELLLVAFASLAMLGTITYTRFAWFF